jgi:uncharacterized membrane protein
MTIKKARKLIFRIGLIFTFVLFMNVIVFLKPTEASIIFLVALSSIFLGFFTSFMTVIAAFSEEIEKKRK